MIRPKTVLVTGATGLIGSYLSKVLLENGYKVYALSRRKDNNSARDRVLDVLKFWDKDILSQKSDNLIALEGDIIVRNLGLDRKIKDLLIDEVEEIFHCAAVTQFNWPLDAIRKVNVEGTRKVLEFAFECNKKGRLKKVNHMSTAYVCGDYKGTFKEDDLDVGQRFNSTYEQSKLEAELLVEEYRKKGLWVDVYRPPFVVGESKSGKTSTVQQSVYQLLHMWNLEIFEYFPAKGFCFNVVFVDDLCVAIFKISSLSLSVSRNYHPFNCKAVSLKNFLNNSGELLGFRKPKLASLNKFFNSNPTPAQKMLLVNNILLFNNDAELDSRMTNKVLKEYGFKFSYFNRDSSMKLLEYCIKKGFLRRKESIRA